ncbi:unnamed protein product, partial [Closterium sp. NIES-54]
MFITLYFIVTRLPDSLRSVRDHFLTLDPTSLTVDLLEQHLLAAETSAVDVGVARGTLRSPFFEGTSGLLRLVRSAAIARARVAGVVEEAAVVVEVAVGMAVGAAVEEAEAVEVVVTFTRRPGSSLYTLATEPPQVAASAQVYASGQVAAACSCRLLSHRTLLWHHRLGRPSLPRLRGMHSRLLVSGLPRSLPPLPPSPAPPCLPCVEGRQHAAPNSSSFPPTTAPLQALHMDVWGPARVIRLQLRARFGQDLPVLRLHSDRGGEFSSDLLRDFCRGEGITKSFTLPDSPQQNGIAERRIGLVMEVARTSMIHAAAPHFLWPFA